MALTMCLCPSAAPRPSVSHTAAPVSRTGVDKRPEGDSWRANQRDVPYHTMSCSAIKLQGKLPCTAAAQGLLVASDCFCTAYISLLLGGFFAFFSLCFFPSLNKLSLSQPVRACSSLLPFNSLPHPTGWQLCWFRKGWKWGTRTIMRYTYNLITCSFHQIPRKHPAFVQYRWHTSTCTRSLAHCRAWWLMWNWL